MEHMKKAQFQDQDRILSYLRKDIVNCIYMYIDIMNYGVESENMSVWLQERDGQIILVVMKYYDSYQIYSDLDKVNVTAVLELLQEYPVTMISARQDIIEQLDEMCEMYQATYGVIFDASCKKRQFRFGDFSDNGNREKVLDVLDATEEDAWEIAELICSDEAFRNNYEVGSLAAQLAERIRTRTGRSCIIRIDGKIVAHHATYAEAEGIAVVSGLVIHPQYRNKGCYDALAKHMGAQLAAEHKKIYAFAISKKTIRYHRAMYTECGTYGKLVKSNMKNQ